MMHATIVPPRVTSVQEVVAALGNVMETAPIFARMHNFSCRAPNTVRSHATLRVMIERSEGLTTVTDKIRAGLGVEAGDFSGHITLAKLKEGYPDGWDQQFVDEFGALKLEDISWHVDRISVLESGGGPYVLKHEIIFQGIRS